MNKFDGDALKSVLQSAHESEKKKGFTVDERFWKSETPAGPNDKNVYVLRTLPIVTKAGMQPPKVKKFSHRFQSPVTGKWVRIECPYTISEACPFCDYASSLFNTGDVIDEKAGYKYYRKTEFVMNVYVVQESNDSRADNVGKVFLWQFGKKINEKFEEAMHNEIESERIIPMHPITGYNFNLIVKKQGEYPNYDSSAFDRASSQITEKDEDITKILDSVYDVNSEFLDKSNFKSFDELKGDLNRLILGAPENAVSNVSATTSKAADKIEDVIEEDDVPIFSSPEPTTPTSDADDDLIASLEAELDL